MAETIFNRAGKWPTLFLLGLEGCGQYLSENWNVADTQSLTVGKLPTITEVLKTSLSKNSGQLQPAVTKA